MGRRAGILMVYLFWRFHDWSKALRKTGIKLSREKPKMPNLAWLCKSTVLPTPLIE
jgi:hypothetical protein